MRRQSLLTTAVTLVFAGASGCATRNGETHRGTAPTAATVTATTDGHPAGRGGYWRQDGDEDFDDAPRYDGSPANDDLGLLAASGPPASRAVARVVGSLVKRYYAASAAEDAPTACSLLVAGIAAAVAAQRGAGSHGTCGRAMSALLAQQHALLAGESVATMAVTAVRVKGNVGLAVLSFRSAPQSDILVERERGGWRIDELFGSRMT